jgi:FtsP/CotA-like multicopper oxidase with cupredoxin domain
MGSGVDLMSRAGDIMETATSSTGRPQRRRRRLAGLALVGATAAVAMAAPISAPSPQAQAAGAMPPEGIVCTAPASGAVGQASFVLNATTGYITTPDGNSIAMWGYAANNSAFQYPGPVLCMNEGDEVTITLRNELPVPTSIEFPGMDDVSADGQPQRPAFAADGSLLALATEAMPGSSVTYSFVAGRPGTYQYTSGSDPALQVQMGLFGVAVVRPALTADTAGLSDSDAAAARLAYDDQSTRYSADHEYLMLLSEIDPDIHLAVEQGAVLHSSEYDAPYDARYFLINGRSFPDNVAPNGAGWLPSQPYGSLAHVEPYDPVANPLPALLRYAAVGIAGYPFHPHSNHERVIAKDARLLVDGGADLSSEKFSIMVNPGATLDATFVWTNVEQYADAPGRELPVAYPVQANLADGEYWSGSPYLGSSGVLNPGINSQNQCGEYYHVAHSHDLTQATNYGAAFGGMLTLIRVEPPDPNNCGE